MSPVFAPWRERLTLFGLTASITAIVALVELRGRSHLPLVSNEIGWTTRSVSDIVQGGIVFAALLEWGAVLWLDRHRGKRSFRDLGRQVLKSAIDAAVAIAALSALELCLRSLADPVDLPLPIAIALGSACCGGYQLFFTRTKIAAARRYGRDDSSEFSER